jgi:hypothetical protein
MKLKLFTIIFIVLTLGTFELAYTDSGVKLGGCLGYYTPDLRTLNQELDDLWYPLNPFDPDLSLSPIEGNTAYAGEVQIGVYPLTSIVINTQLWQGRTSVKWEVVTDIDTEVIYQVELNPLIIKGKYNLVSGQQYNEEKSKIFVTAGIGQYNTVLKGTRFITMYDVDIGVDHYDSLIAINRIEAKGSTFVGILGAGGEFTMSTNIFFGFTVDYIIGTVDKLEVTHSSMSGIEAGNAVTYNSSENLPLELGGLNCYISINVAL